LVTALQLITFTKCGSYSNDSCIILFKSLLVVQVVVEAPSDRAEKMRIVGADVDRFTCSNIMDLKIGVTMQKYRGKNA